MYDELIRLGKKYVGATAEIFIDAVIEDAKVDQKSITDKDLDVIANIFLKKLGTYGINMEAYKEQVTKDVLALKINN